jgi:hypothetical protein
MLALDASREVRAEEEAGDLGGAPDTLAPGVGQPAAEVPEHPASDRDVGPPRCDGQRLCDTELQLTAADRCQVPACDFEHGRLTLHADQLACDRRDQPGDASRAHADLVPRHR